jgi:REP element-mobilizing transposase RayT
MVFSTKNRAPYLLASEIRAEMHAYLGGVSNRFGAPPLLVGGTEDHIHALCRLGRSIPFAELVKELKRVSSLWIKNVHQIYLIFLGNRDMEFFLLAHPISILFRHTLEIRRNITEN